MDQAPSAPTIRSKGGEEVPSVKVRVCCCVSLVVPGVCGSTLATFLFHWIARGSTASSKICRRSLRSISGRPSMMSCGSATCVPSMRVACGSPGGASPGSGSPFSSHRTSPAGLTNLSASPDGRDFFAKAPRRPAALSASWPVLGCSRACRLGRGGRDRIRGRRL